MTKEERLKRDIKLIVDDYGPRNTFIEALDNFIAYCIGDYEFKEIKKSEILLDIVRVYTCSCIACHIFEYQLGYLHLKVNSRC